MKHGEIIPIRAGGELCEAYEGNGIEDGKM